jgi:hypothetical protein
MHPVHPPPGYAPVCKGTIVTEILYTSQQLGPRVWEWCGTPETWMGLYDDRLRRRVAGKNSPPAGLKKKVWPFKDCHTLER